MTNNHCDCGTKLYDGICPNCDPEIVIMGDEQLDDGGKHV